LINGAEKLPNMCIPFLSPSASKSPVQGATQPKSKYLNFMTEEKKKLQINIALITYWRNVVSFFIYRSCKISKNIARTE
jgi:hypothetical protein